MRRESLYLFAAFAEVRCVGKLETGARGLGAHVAISLLSAGFNGFYPHLMQTELFPCTKAHTNPLKDLFGAGAGKAFAPPMGAKGNDVKRCPVNNRPTTKIVSLFSLLVKEFFWKFPSVTFNIALEVAEGEANIWRSLTKCVRPALNRRVMSDILLFCDPVGLH